MRTLLRPALLLGCLIGGACSVQSDEDLNATEEALQGAGGISASLRVSAVFVGGYCARVTLDNSGTRPTTSWTTTLDLEGERITWSADATFSGTTGAVNVSSNASNGRIAAGSSTQYRFCASGTYRDPAEVTAVSAVFEGGPDGSGGSAGSAVGGSAGAAVGGGNVGGSTSTGGSIGTGPQPILPAITGTCPRFVSGTATIAGLSGISLQVGPRRSGTGSLLFYWHGTGSSAAEVNSMVPAAVRQDILAQGGVIVSFQRSTGTGGDCSGTRTFSKDDFKIADLIAACAVRDHSIDPRRIYTTGCSAGGLQAGCMGALRSNYIAATVPNSGGELTRQPIQNSATTPAVMTMHGGPSDRVGVSFATTSATLDAHMKGAGSFVINCNHGGGHCRAPSALYSAAWTFMQAHPFGVEPEPYSSALPSSFPSYCRRY